MLPRRFWSKVNKNGPVPESAPHLGPCWIWTAALSDGGYGIFGIGRRDEGTARAHRLTYEEIIGPITKPQLDHLCRVRSCVNPEHLEPVTNRENVRRGNGMFVGGAMQRSKTHCPKGHEYTPANTRLYEARGIRERACRACNRERMRAKRCHLPASSS